MIIYKPEIVNNTSLAFSIEKAKGDFDLIPEYADFRTMMIDYKKNFDERKY